MTTSTSSTTDARHPDAQQLAAFLEGQLDGDVRTRVVAHLARCAECAEVFADAAAFQAEEEGWNVEGAEDEKEEAENTEREERAGSKDNVLRFPASARFWTIGTLVAAALTVILLQTPALRWLVESPAPMTLSAEDWRRLQPDYRWNKTRSSELTLAAEMTAQTAFRLGVRVEEWHWSYASAPDESTQELYTRQLFALTRPLGKSGEILGSLEAPEQFERGLSKIKHQLEPDQRDAFEFGRWAARAHFQALQANLDFFRNRNSRKYLLRVAGMTSGDTSFLADLQASEPTVETWQTLRAALRTAIEDGPGDAP